MFLLSQKPSIADHYLAELRDVNCQTDRMRFRRNMERVGELLAYELSKTLTFKTEKVETPLGTAPCRSMLQPIVLATILRAGLPFHQGFLNIFDKADNAFISAYRKHNKDGSFEISLDYISCPELENRVIIVSDPMLATGSSLVKTIEHLEELKESDHKALLY